MNKETPISAGLFRRFAAIAYDSFLLAGLLFIAGLPLPLIPDSMQLSLAVSLAIRVYLFLVCFVFFGWFWTNGGQTLGMRAWDLRLVRIDGANITWPQASVRFLAAILSWTCIGLGFVWLQFSPDKLTWHDRLSHTRIVRVSHQQSPTSD